MVGMGFGFGFRLGGRRPPASPKSLGNGGPELLLQAELIYRGSKTNDGVLVRAAALPWLEIVNHLERHPDFLHQFANNSRKFEEFIAACYERDGFEVTLTPQRDDKGRDVIAEKRGFGAIRFLEQAKAYSPGHLVTHGDVREMLGALSTDHSASKGIITTTSDFQPGIFKSDSQFANLMPTRLELKNGLQTLEWIKDIKQRRSNS